MGLDFGGPPGRHTQELSFPTKRGGTQHQHRQISQPRFPAEFRVTRLLVSSLCVSTPWSTPRDPHPPDARARTHTRAHTCAHTPTPTPTPHSRGAGRPMGEVLRVGFRAGTVRVGLVRPEWGVVQPTPLGGWGRGKGAWATRMEGNGGTWQRGESSARAVSSECFSPFSRTAAGWHGAMPSGQVAILGVGCPPRNTWRRPEPTRIGRLPDGSGAAGQLRPCFFVLARQARSRPRALPPPATRKRQRFPRPSWSAHAHARTRALGL